MSGIDSARFYWLEITLQWVILIFPQWLWKKTLIHKYPVATPWGDPHVWMMSDNVIWTIITRPLGFLNTVPKSLGTVGNGFAHAEKISTAARPGFALSGIRFYSWNSKFNCFPEKFQLDLVVKFAAITVENWPYVMAVKLKLNAELTFFCFCNKQLLFQQYVCGLLKK